MHEKNKQEKVWRNKILCPINFGKAQVEEVYGGITWINAPKIEKEYGFTRKEIINMFTKYKILSLCSFKRQNMGWKSSEEIVDECGVNF